MKFDVIAGNPPYQTKSADSDTKTQPIWNKFVKKSLELLKPNEFLCYVHPSGWRSSGNIFEDAKELKKRQIEYLEIHGEDDGNKVFGATTRYDWYVLKNCLPSHLTTIKDQDGNIVKENIADKSFIPNAQSDVIYAFLAKPGEEKVEIIHSWTAYESRQPYISENKHGQFKYPVVYSVPVEAPTIWFSSTKDRGHFGISKVILNASRPLSCVVDLKGEYGMSQFCVGIVGDKQYLEMVADVIQNQKANGFAKFMESCSFTDKLFNKEVISQFRKDFWKAFV